MESLPLYKEEKGSAPVVNDRAGFEVRLVWFHAAHWLLDPNPQRNDSQMIQLQTSGEKGAFPQSQ